MILTYILFLHKLCVKCESFKELGYEMAMSRARAIVHDSSLFIERFQLSVEKFHTDYVTL